MRFIFLFWAVFCYEQISHSASTAVSAGKANDSVDKTYPGFLYMRSIEKKILEKKEIKEIEIKQAIEKEFKNIQDLKIQTSVLTTLFRLIAIHGQIIYVNNLDKDIYEKESAQLNAFLTKNKIKIDQRYIKFHFEHVAQFLDSVDNPVISEMHWKFFTDTPLLMTNPEIATKVWNSYASTALYQGSLNNAIALTQDWLLESKDDKFKVDSLLSQSRIAYGFRNLQVMQSLIAKMEKYNLTKAQKIEFEIRKASVESLKENFEVCANSLEKILSQTPKPDARKIVSASAIRARCLYGANKKQEAFDQIEKVKLNPEAVKSANFSGVLLAELFLNIREKRINSIMGLCSSIEPTIPGQDYYEFLMVYVACKHFAGPKRPLPVSLQKRFTSTLASLKAAGSRSKPLGELVSYIETTQSGLGTAVQKEAQKNLIKSFANTYVGAALRINSVE